MPGRGREPDTPEAAALAAASRILSARDHGAGELRQKLLRKGHALPAVEAALAALAGRGLLDDAAAAARLLEEELARGNGPLKVRAKLRARGITAEPPRDPEAEEASLRALLRRRRVDAAALTDPAARAKISRFLRGRGYGAAAVARVLGEPQD